MPVKPATRQIMPDDDETYDDWMDRCGDEYGDDDYCDSVWQQNSAKGATNRSGVVHKIHEGKVGGLEFVLSDETPDRYDDVIAVEGWDLANFRKNPIAQFNHNANFPIGTWRNLRVENKQLRGHLELAPFGTSERIDEIHKLIDADVLKTVSVGFIGKASEVRDAAKFSVRYTKAELIETSLVPVPANPNALVVAKRLNISGDTLKLVFAEPGRRNERLRRRRLTGELALIPQVRRGGAMTLAQRITELQKSLLADKDALTAHLGTTEDADTNDEQLAITEELTGRIAQKEKTLASLQSAEKHLAASSSSTALALASPPALQGEVLPGKRPFSFRAKKVSPMDYVVRAGAAQLIAHTRKISIEAARQMLAKINRNYDDDGVKVFCNYVSRSTTSPAMTTVTGWAAELVQEVHADFMELLQPQSIYPQLAALGLSLDFGRNGRIAIPTRSRTPTIAGSFVGEGQPIPVRQGQFTAQILTPKKMAVITTWTREIDEHSIPAIEGLLRSAIQEDTAVSLDSVLLDAMPATEIRPPGLLNGVAALPATVGGGFNAIVGDLKQLSGALLEATRGNVRVMAWMMNPQQTLSLSLTAMPGMSAFPFAAEVSTGRLLGRAILESATVPMRSVVVIDAADFVTVGGEAPRFEVSDQATLHMEDTDPAEIVDGSGAHAAPVRSMFQTDSLALRLILPINWTMRRPGMVAWTQGVTW